MLEQSDREGLTLVLGKRLGSAYEALDSHSERRIGIGKWRFFSSGRRP